MKRFICMAALAAAAAFAQDKAAAPADKKAAPPGKATAPGKMEMLRPAEEMSVEKWFAGRRTSRLAPAPPPRSSSRLAMSAQST